VFSQADLVADSLQICNGVEIVGGGTSKFPFGGSKTVSDRATQFLRRQITFEAA
jgi:glutamate racemase